MAALNDSEKEYGLTILDHGGTGQEFTEYENEAGTGVHVALETSQEGGKQKSSFLEAGGNLLTFNSTAKIIN